MITKDKKELTEKIIEFTKTLHLPAFRKCFESEAKEALSKDLSFEEYLYCLLEKECDMRYDNMLKKRVRMAEFPYKKYLEELIVEDLPEDDRKKLKLLKTLDFVKEGQNVILAGNPGTGKTHIAIGLGIKACLEGYKVWFTTVPLFITMLKEARSQKTLRNFENRFLKYDLVILDELGYISFDKEGAELLFTNLSLRAGRKSTIITTNLSFERWDEVFQDPIMTAAMTDRLTTYS
ncbi:MAG TPA: IS21-like element helper ATPase IstB [Pseudobacteroides sp.]|nr:IS21-like element helper ATPase IstB [Pseudobacteroides sp.]